MRNTPIHNNCYGKPCERNEIAPLCTSWVLDEAASVLLLSRRHRLRAIRGFQMTRFVVWFKAPPLVRCVIRHGNSPTKKEIALKISNHAIMVNSVAYDDFSFLAVKKNPKNFCTASKKERAVSFLAAQIVDIVEYMASSYFLTGNSTQIFNRCIRAAKFLLRRSVDLRNLKHSDVKETGAGTLCNSQLDDESRFCRIQRKNHFCFVSQVSTSETQWRTIRSTGRLLKKSERDLLRELHCHY